jgi:hypothetical protein
MLRVKLRTLRNGTQGEMERSLRGSGARIFLD